MDFLRALPPELTRQRVYPFAVRVIHDKEELIQAVDEYVHAKAAILRRDGNQRAAATQPYPIGEWDVSNVRDFSHVFDARRNPLLIDFNEDISKWDVSNATDLNHMFSGCQSFNADLSRWNVSKATDLHSMFINCQSFNANVSAWNVSNATNMSAMFAGCSAFQSDVSGWNVSRVTNLSFLFFNCSSFDSNVSDWNPSSATDLSSMFSGCHAFDSDVSGWNVSNATTLRSMFSGCRFFRSDVSSWNVSSATDLSSMFRDCHSFNSDLSEWNVSKAVDLSGMFSGCRSFNAGGNSAAGLVRWVYSFYNRRRPRRRRSLKGRQVGLSRWNVSNATDLSFMFQHCRSFNSDLSEWFTISNNAKQVIHSTKRRFRNGPSVLKKSAKCLPREEQDMIIQGCGKVPNIVNISFNWYV
jgi:surface protein